MMLVNILRGLKSVQLQQITLLVLGSYADITLVTDLYYIKRGHCSLERTAILTSYMAFYFHSHIARAEVSISAYTYTLCLSIIELNV